MTIFWAIFFYFVFASCHVVPVVVVAVVVLSEFSFTWKWKLWRFVCFLLPPAKWEKDLLLVFQVCGLTGDCLSVSPVAVVNMCDTQQLLATTNCSCLVWYRNKRLCELKTKRNEKNRINQIQILRCDKYVTVWCRDCDSKLLCPTLGVFLYCHCLTFVSYQYRITIARHATPWLKTRQCNSLLPWIIQGSLFRHIP